MVANQKKQKNLFPQMTADKRVTARMGVDQADWRCNSGNVLAA
jgi:hypothetical protein